MERTQMITAPVSSLFSKPVDRSNENTVEEPSKAHDTKTTETSESNQSQTQANETRKPETMSVSQRFEPAFDAVVEPVQARPISLTEVETGYSQARLLAEQARQSLSVDLMIGRLTTSRDSETDKYAMNQQMEINQSSEYVNAGAKLAMNHTV